MAFLCSTFHFFNSSQFFPQVNLVWTVILLQKFFFFLSFKCPLFPPSCRPTGFPMARNCQCLFQESGQQKTVSNNDWGIFQIMLFLENYWTLSGEYYNMLILKEKEINWFSFHLPASPTNTSTGVLVGLSPMTLYAVISTSYLLYFFNSEKVKYYMLILYIMIYTVLQLSFRLQHLFISRLVSQSRAGAIELYNSAMPTSSLPEFTHHEAFASFSKIFVMKWQDFLEFSHSVRNSLQ